MKIPATLKTTLTLAFTLAGLWSAQAATDTWTGGSSTTGNWSDAANWGGTAPNATGDSFVFSGSTQPVNTNDLVTASSWLQFSPSTALTIYGNGVTNSAGITNSSQNNTLNLPVGLGASQTIFIASGTSLTLSNLIFAGNYTATVLGGGALNLNGSSVNLASLGATAFIATNLGSFDYVNSAGALNFTVATSGTTTINRLGTNVNITASNFGVGQNGPGGSGTSQTDNLYLGQTNVIDAGTIYVGYNSAATGNAYLRFGGGINSPSLVIRGSSGGTSRANLNVGYIQGSDYAQGQGTFDLTNGVSNSTLDALLGTVIIGYRTGGGGNFSYYGNGTFVFGAGTLDATSIVLGQADTKAKTGNGTLTANGGMVKVQTLTLGNQTAAVSAGAVAANGTLNANPGSLIEAALIRSGAGVGGTTTNVRTININGATLANYDVSTSLVVSNLAVTLAGGNANTLQSSAGQMIAFTNNARLVGTGGFTVTGGGTVQLFGTNTYSGTTTINNGTLALVGYGSISNTSLITVAGGATFDVSGLTNAFVLGSGQTLSNSAAATGVLNGSLNTAFGSVSLTYAAGTPALNLNTGTLNLSSSTVFTINNTGASLPIGSYVIISTNAGGLVTGTAPSVTVNGGGVAAGWALVITNGELALNVFGRTDTWTGGSATTGNWSDAGNWGGTAPDSAGDTLSFSGSGRPSNTNNSVSSVISVQLNTSAPFALYGNALTLVAGMTNFAGNNTWNIPLTFSANQNFNVASGTALTLGGTVAGSFSLTKTGSGTLGLAAADSRTGNTIVSGGTLALSGAASIAGTPLISLAGGTTLDVSGLTSTFALGGGQILSNTAAATANLNGSLNTASGALSLSCLAGTPSLAVGNGTLTLSASTTCSLNNMGAALPVGTYVIIATNAGGLVAGTAPGVTVNGGGVAAGMSLVITNGELDLILATRTDTWTGGSSASANWSDAANWGGTAPNPFGDSLIFAGTTQPINTNNFVSTATWLLLNPSAPFTFYGNAVTVASAVTNASQNNIWYNPLVLGGNVNFSVASGTTLTLSNAVSGTGQGLSQTGGGTLNLGSLANTFTGPVAVTAGTLELGNLTGLETYAFPGSALFVNNATLYFNGNNNSSAITHTYNFPNLTGPIGLTNATLSFQSGSSTTKALNAPVSFGGANIVSYTSSSYTHELDFDGAVTGGGTLVFNWNGTTTGRSIAVNSSGNSFAGTVILGATPAAGNFNLNYSLGPAAFVVSNAWTLVNGATNNLDSATAVTLASSSSGLNLSSYGWSNSAASLTINAGTVTLGNATVGTIVSIGNLSGAGGTIINNGSIASLLTVNQTSNLTYAGVITDDGSAPLSFTKNGPAMLTLSGANTYAGNTTVRAGTLGVSGSLASPTVTISSGGTLDGNGTLSGATVVNAGGTLSAVDNAAFNLNNLTFGASSSDRLTLTLQGDGTTVAGYVAVGGSLVNNGTVTVNVVGALPSTTGAYTLLTYSGAITGPGTFVKGSLTSGVFGYLTNNVAASAIQLVVTGSDYLRWVGSPTNDWDLVGNNDWRFGSSGLPGSFANSQSVVFDDTASGFTVNVAAAVAPGGVNFSNNANGYLLAGSGKITGGTTLALNGGGIVTLATTNDYTGLTMINGGTLQLGDGTANNGTVNSGITDNGALVFADPGNQTYAGIISGTGTVAKTAAGALTVSGDNTYTGATTISGGTLVAGNTNALGTTDAGTTVSGGTLDVNGQNLGAEAVGIAGQGTGTNGAVINNGPAQTQALQSLTLNANATVGGNSRWDVRGSGSTLNLNGQTLTKTGTNQITVVQSTVLDGNIVVNQGELGFQAGASFPTGLGLITVNPGGTLGVSDWGTALQVSQPVMLNGGTLLSDSGGTTATLASAVALTTNSTIIANCPLSLVNATNAVGGTGNLTVGGTSTLILDAPTNTWLGGLVINSNATLQIGNNDSNGSLPATVTVVTNNGLLAYSQSADMYFTQPMVGTGGLEQAGPNTITITNVQRYTGGTVVASGTLTLAAGNNTLSNATTLAFIGSGTLNLGTNSQVVSGLTINNSMSGSIQGAAALTVIGANSLRLGSTGNTTPALDMSTLYKFNYNEPSNAFSVGGQATAANSSGSLNLALTNTITASQFGVADNGGYPGYTTAGTLNLGLMNVINANLVAVGYGHSANGGFAATGTLGFYSGTANPSLVIRDATGTNRANITIGYDAGSDYSAGTGTIDLVAGVTGASTLDALVGNLIIGQQNYNNVNLTETATGTFTMGNGTLDATNIVLGQKTLNGGKTSSSAVGTFSLNGGTVKVNSMLIGDQEYTNGPSVTGNFNLNSGALLAGTIKAGVGSATRTFNWNDGVIQNYNSGTDLTIAGITLALTGSGTPTFNLSAGRTGTIASSVTGSGALVNAGSGTLILNADNSGFSGTLTNAAGTLYANGPMSSGTIEVYHSAVLAGSNMVGTILIDAGGIIQPGDIKTNGVLSASTLNLGASATDITYSRFNLATGTQISSSALTVNGTNVVNITGPITAVGTNNLILYSGSIGGSGIGGFKLGSLPNGVTAYLVNNAGTAVQLAVTSVFTVNTNPPVLTNSISGSTLSLTWPTDHLGWRLEVQTNSLSTGLGTNWATWPNSTNLTTVPITINPASPSVFFRMVYP